MRHYERKRKIIEYFQKNFKKGYPLESLKWALINQGYLKLEVESALEEAQKELAEKAPLLKEKPQITYEAFGEGNSPLSLKKPWWKRIFGL
jgi:hypothetical protein